MTNKSKKLRNIKMSKKSRKTRGGSITEWISNKVKNTNDKIEESTTISDTANKVLDRFTWKHHKQVDAVINLIKNAKKLGESIKSGLTLPDIPNNLRDLIKTADNHEGPNGKFKVLNETIEDDSEHQLKRIIKNTIDSFPETPESRWNKENKKHLKSLVIIVLIDKYPLILHDNEHDNRPKIITLLEQLEKKSNDSYDDDVFQKVNNQYGNQQYDYLKDILKNKMDPPIEFPTKDAHGNSLPTIKDTNGTTVPYIKGKDGTVLKTPHAIIDDVLGKELIINYIKKQTGERTEGGKSKKLRKSSKTRRKSKKMLKKGGNLFSGLKKRFLGEKKEQEEQEETSEQSIKDFDSLYDDLEKVEVTGEPTEEQRQKLFDIKIKLLKLIEQGDDNGKIWNEKCKPCDKFFKNMKELIHTVEVIITKLNIKFGEEKERLNEDEIFDQTVKFDFKKAIQETETAKLKPKANNTTEEPHTTSTGGKSNKKRSTKRSRK